MPKYLFILVALVQTLSAANHSIDHAIPSWVKEVPLALEKPVDEGSHTQVLLVDRQINLDEGSCFFHVVKRLCTSTAVQEGSLLEIEFDPTYQSVVLHSLLIYRNHERLDKSTSRQEVVQQESEIHRHLYNGRKTWLIFIDDVQPGDLVEYSYSIIGENPVMKGHLAKTFSWESDKPFGHTLFRFISSKPLYFKGAKPIPLSDKEWLLELTDISPHALESLQPSWYMDPPTTLQISTFADWAEVAKWGSELFKIPKEMNQTVTASWSHLPLEEKILAATRFVQDDIRYLGFEMGSNNCLPHDPNIVLQQRSGDCKDKVLLLRTLLHAMGVESYPLLVSSWCREHLDEWHPASSLFNHVILQVSLGNERIFLDPTCSLQGGQLRTCSHFSYGKGLLLKETSTTLTDIPEAPVPGRYTTARFTFSNTETTATLQIEMLFTGKEADDTRDWHQNEGLKGIEKSFVDCYAKKYGKLDKKSPLTFEDDREKNEVRVKIDFELLDLWKIDHERQQKTFTHSAFDIATTINFDISPSRETPLRLAHPIYVVEDVYVTNPQRKWESFPSHRDLSSDEISFSSGTTEEGYTLHLQLKFLSKKDHVPPESFENHRLLVKRLEDEISHTVTLPTVLPPEAASGINYVILALITAGYGWAFTRFRRSP